MPEKPTTAAGYAADYVEHVRSTCLYVATKLGDLTDHLVVVGGLVPSLLVDQQHRAEGVEAHVGTMDLDIGLAVVTGRGSPSAGTRSRERRPCATFGSAVPERTSS